jgi:hypothetical protein
MFKLRKLLTIVITPGWLEMFDNDLLRKEQETNSQRSRPAIKKYQMMMTLTMVMNRALMCSKRNFQNS